MRFTFSSLWSELKYLKKDSQQTIDNREKEIYEEYIIAIANHP